MKKQLKGKQSLRTGKRGEGKTGKGKKHKKGKGGRGRGKKDDHVHKEVT